MVEEKTKTEGEMEDEEYCDEDCEKCPIKLNYTMFDQEDDGEID